MGIIAWLLGKSSKESKMDFVPSPSVESWRIWCMPLSVATDTPIEFVLAWIQKESAGNPCAWGTANAKGPDGHPREQGLAQLYNPDDMKRFNIPSGAFRVYCVPGTQKQSRALTAEESAAQVKAVYQLIGWHRSKAEEALRKNGARWSAKDYWRAVKLDHALPGLVRQGLARVTASLGRAPKDWYEFRAAIAKVKLDPGTERYRSAFTRLLDNAEKTGGVVPSDAREPMV